MFLAILLTSALLTGNIATMAKALIVWPPNLTTLPFQTVNITAGNRTTLLFNSTATVGNETTLPDNSTATIDNLITLPSIYTALVANWTRLLVASLNTGNNDSVLLEPIGPPPSDIAKRLPSDSRSHYQSLCDALRPSLLAVIDFQSSIQYKKSICGSRWTVAITCGWFDRFGIEQQTSTYVACAFEEPCVAELVDEVSHAWCARFDHQTKVVPGPAGGQFGIKSRSPSTQYLAVVNNYWDAKTGLPEGVANTTFLTSTPDHKRTEVDGFVSSRVQSEFAWMGYDEGWDIYVTPGIGDGMTLVDSYLLSLT